MAIHVRADSSTLLLQKKEWRRGDPNESEEQRILRKPKLVAPPITAVSPRIIPPHAKKEAQLRSLATELGYVCFPELQLIC
ncbi:hypothetical protein AB1Y20_005562 [Prymnesium parvum]|uniref:Uncharacterized protein n=1 Tax=Prymnesium parvum TaxID=97485 RepID=A0AB34J6K8_PRYPA